MGRFSRLLPLIVSASLGAVAPAEAGNPAHGKILSARCVACHGPGGETNDPMIPKIAGQNGTYLLRQLENFKSGARQNPIMTPQAQALSESEMDDLAAYYAGLNPAVPAAARTSTP